MNKEQKLHIAETLKYQRGELNTMYMKLRDTINKLDDLEMYVRMLPVDKTENPRSKEHYEKYHG